MKKILLVISSLFLLVGCDALDNTPTKKVEKLLDNYRNHDVVVLNQLDTVINNDITMTNDQKIVYKDALKKQYADLMYTVKDEKIDGNNAIVTVEIEVYDYDKVYEDADAYLLEHQTEFQDITTSQYSEGLFMTYKINQLSKTNTRIKYTIDFRVTKTNRTWVVADLTDADREKIHGLYAS